MEPRRLLLELTSPDPKGLKSFYRDVVRLPQPTGLDMFDNLFDIGGALLGVDGHSEIRGPTVEPARVLINLVVDDLASEQSRLEDSGVEFIRSAGREFWGGLISTFLDPDGNYIQLMQWPAQ